MVSLGYGNSVVLPMGTFSGRCERQRSINKPEYILEALKKTPDGRTVILSELNLSSPSEVQFPCNFPVSASGTITSPIPWKMSFWTTSFPLSFSSTPNCSFYKISPCHCLLFIPTTKIIVVVLTIDLRFVIISCLSPRVSLFYCTWHLSWECSS